MTSLKQIFDLGQSTALRERVMASIIHHACAVLAESEPPAPRLALARSVMVGAEGYVAMFSRQCADNEKIAELAYAKDELDVDNVPDDLIVAVIEKSWNLIGGL